MKYWASCRLSLAGEYVLKADHRRVDGHIIGESNDKTRWRVTWGNKLNTTNGRGVYLKEHIEILEPNFVTTKPKHNAKHHVSGPC